MFSTTKTQVILWHDDPWAVEDRRFIHILPDKVVHHSALEDSIVEKTIPPASR